MMPPTGDEMRGGPRVADFSGRWAWRGRLGMGDVAHLLAGRDPDRRPGTRDDTSNCSCIDAAHQQRGSLIITAAGHSMLPRVAVPRSAACPHRVSLWLHHECPSPLTMESGGIHRGLQTDSSVDTKTIVFQIFGSQWDIKLMLPIYSIGNYKHDCGPTALRCGRAKR